MGQQFTFCDGLPRRDFIHWGSAQLFGMGISLAEILRCQASGAADPDPNTKAKHSRRDVSLIFVFLHGGLSTIDSWDLKPDAPAEFRGPFQPIATNVPGISIGEHLPKIARVMDKIALIRSFRHHNSDHGPADHYMFTGYFPQAGFNPTLKPNNQKPACGSVIARMLGPRGSVPPYVCLPRLHPSGSSAYLGPMAAPFVVEADPNAPDFQVPDLLPPAVLPTDRLHARRQLLAQVDRYRRVAERRVNRNADTMATFQENAFALMTSPAAAKAFDIHAENSALRDAYGRNSLGQSCLMARRLVEAGVRCVTIDHSNWDTHDGNFATLKTSLLPTLDHAIATLFTDLAQRGMLESTLVLISGEFGRTPRINNNAGRDHWGPAFTVALGGGGIQGGRVVGASDARAERPATTPFGPEDLFATIYHQLGLDANHEFYTPEGRPVKIVDNGRVIHDLL